MDNNDLKRQATDSYHKFLDLKLPFYTDMRLAGCPEAGAEYMSTHIIDAWITLLHNIPVDDEKGAPVSKLMLPIGVTDDEVIRAVLRQVMTDEVITQRIIDNVATCWIHLRTLLINNVFKNFDPKEMLIAIELSPSTFLVPNNFDGEGEPALRMFSTKEAAKKYSHAGFEMHQQKGGQ